jgi:hypothetical protein
VYGAAPAGQPTHRELTAVMLAPRANVRRWWATRINVLKTRPNLRFVKTTATSKVLALFRSNL